MPWAQVGYLGLNLNLGTLSCIEWIVVENGKRVANPVYRYKPEKFLQLRLLLLISWVAVIPDF